MHGLGADETAELLRWIKDGPPGAIPFGPAGRSVGRLQAVRGDDASDRCLLDRLARWHADAFAWFSEPFAVTPGGVRDWLVGQVLADENRLLFWVRDVKGETHGHVGLTVVDAAGGLARIGDVIAAGPRSRPLVSAAVEALADWAAGELGLTPQRASQALAAA